MAKFGLFSRVRFYLGLPAVIIYLGLFAMLWRPLANHLFQGLDFVKQEVVPPNWLPELAQNVISDIIAVTIIGVVYLAILRQKRLSNICGRFHAFETTGGAKEAWGTVTLSYELLPSGLFDPQLRCRLEHNDIILIGQATITNDQYLCGHYRETSNLARRRVGAFLLRLAGDGDSFNGTFVFLDPKTEIPTNGTISWERIK
jgi:hypothetical protein